MNITGQILLAAGILAAIGVIGKSIHWTVVRVLRPMSQVAEDWRGEEERPGVPGRPGIMPRLQTIEDRLVMLSTLERSVRLLMARIEAIEKELHPNGGSTLRDKVDQIADLSRTDEVKKLKVTE